MDDGKIERVLKMEGKKVIRSKKKPPPVVHLRGGGRKVRKVGVAGVGKSKQQRQTSVFSHEQELAHTNDEISYIDYLVHNLAPQHATYVKTKSLSSYALNQYCGGGVFNGVGDDDFIFTNGVTAATAGVQPRHSSPMRHPSSLNYSLQFSDLDLSDVKDLSRLMTPETRSDFELRKRAHLGATRAVEYTRQERKVYRKILRWKNQERVSNYKSATTAKTVASSDDDDSQDLANISAIENLPSGKKRPNRKSAKVRGRIAAEVKVGKGVISRIGGGKSGLVVAPRKVTDGSRIRMKENSRKSRKFEAAKEYPKGLVEEEDTKPKTPTYRFKSRRKSAPKENKLPKTPPILTPPPPVARSSPLLHRHSPQDQSPRLNSNPSPLQSIREAPVAELEDRENKDEARNVRDIMATVTWPQRDPSLSERRLRSNPSPLAAIPEQERNQAPFRSRLVGGTGFDACNNPQENNDETKVENAEIKGWFVEDGKHDDAKPLVRSDKVPWQHDTPPPDPSIENTHRDVTTSEPTSHVVASSREDESVRSKVVPVFEAPSRIEERLRARREKKEKAREESQRRARSAERAGRRHGVRPQRVRSSSLDSGQSVIGAPAAIELRMLERRERKEREERLVAQLQQEEEERQKRIRRTPVVMTPVYQPEVSDYSSKFRRSRDHIDIPKL